MAKPPGPVTTLVSADVAQMSKVEKLKAASEGLFFVAGAEPHSFASEIDALSRGEAETLGNDAKELSKFFGIYKQQERDLRGSKSGDYIFMVRMKIPAGGELTPEQWLSLDQAADRFGNGTLRITSRQGIQFHYVYGKKLGPLVRFLNESYPNENYRLTTLGACGDVNRNTMLSPVDDLDAELPLRSRELVYAIATELAPRSSAYYQIFLQDDAAQRQTPVTSDEPLYGKHYLPRKFKVGIAHPRDNSIDLLTQDVGFLPVVNGKGAEAYDLHTGGGLGVTHNQAQTAAHLGLYLGRVPREQVVETVKAIAVLQKEQGERKDRRQARWKYTIRRLGPEAVARELRGRFGIRLEAAEPQPLPPNRFFHGWHAEAGGRLFLGVAVENGRVQDADGRHLRSALRAVLEEVRPGVRLTPNQDLLLCHVDPTQRARVDEILAEHGVSAPRAEGRARAQALACPAKPTCGLAMTDAENVLPSYLDAIEAAGLGDVDVVIRMSGCPNSCSRPPTAEIGIIGYGKNDHTIHVGGSREGTRLGKLLYGRVPEEDIVAVLIGILRALRESNPAELPAGEFLHQTPVERLRELVGYAEG